MAKAAIWPNTDAEVRKHGEQTGFSGAANAISRPPGEYGRKTKTQMN